MRPVDPCPERLARRTGLLAAGLALVGGLLVLTVMDASRGQNALDVPAPEHQRVLRRLTPQKWSFFTREPQEEDIAVWRPSGAGWSIATPGSNSEPRHAFGFDRVARAVNTEKGLLLLSLPGSAFEDCEGEIDGCLDDLTAVTELDNPAPVAHLCGDLAFVRQAPVPWAWARSRPDVAMPAAVARVRVTC